MKKIETVIHPVYFDSMHAALARLGVSGTLRQVMTFGRIPPRREVYRGSVYMRETSSELELSLVVPDELLDAALAAIAQAAGDADVIVSSVQALGRAQSGRPRLVSSTVVAAPSANHASLAAAGR